MHKGEGSQNPSMKKKIRLNKIPLLCLLTAFMQTACAEGSVWDRPTASLSGPKEMTVYRSPTCGCCEKWIGHMKKQGFIIKEIQSEDMEAIKQKLGIEQSLQSCHTAVVGGYVVEGHVPAADVKKLLKTKPQAVGLAAPGMPAGSPGMEMGGLKANFPVLLFDKQGNADKFNEYSNH